MATRRLLSTPCACSRAHVAPYPASPSLRRTFHASSTQLESELPSTSYQSRSPSKWRGAEAHDRRKAREAYAETTAFLASIPSSLVTPRTAGRDRTGDGRRSSGSLIEPEGKGSLKEAFAQARELGLDGNAGEAAAVRPFGADALGPKALDNSEPVIATESAVAAAEADVLVVAPPKPVYQTDPFTLPESPLLSFLTNLLMRSGHKDRARRELNLVLSTIRSTTLAPPLPLLKVALHLASPSIRTRSRKSGAKRIYWPVALNERQRLHKAWEWIIDGARARKGKPARGSGKGQKDETKFGVRIALEVLDVLRGTSEVIRKKNEVHKLGMQNRHEAQARSAGRR